MSSTLKNSHNSKNFIEKKRKKWNKEADLKLVGMQNTMVMSELDPWKGL